MERGRATLRARGRRSADPRVAPRHGPPRSPIRRPRRRYRRGHAREPVEPSSSPRWPPPAPGGRRARRRAAGTGRTHPAPHRTVLVPLTEHRGPAPAGRLLRPAVAPHPRRRPVRCRVRFPGLVTQLAEVRGGYVLVNQRDDVEARTTFRFVNPLGRSRVVGHGWFAYLTAVSADGSRIAFSTGGGAPHVRRTRRGREDRVPAVPGGGEVVALGRIRSLVTVGSHTVWWTPAHRTGHALLRRRGLRRGPDRTPGRAAARRHLETYVGSFPRGSRPGWVLPGRRAGRPLRRRRPAGAHPGTPARPARPAAATRCCGCGRPRPRRRSTDVRRSARPGAGPALGGPDDVPGPGPGAPPAPRDGPGGVAAVHGRRPVRARQHGLHARPGHGSSRRWCSPCSAPAEPSHSPVDPPRRVAPGSARLLR